MTTTESLRDTIAGALRSAGLAGRGTVWRRRGMDVQWVVHIDRLPYGSRFGVDVGLDLQTETPPRLANHCQIVIGLEHLGFLDSSAVVEALDADSWLSDDRRREVLESAISGLVAYIDARQSLVEVADAYRAGELSAAFIHKDARATLESTSRP